jgi:hypothetical protein
MTREARTRGHPQSTLSRVLVLVAAALGLASIATATGAQQPATISAPRGSIVGVAALEVDGRPIAGARVQLTASDREVDTDSLGEFRFADVAPGRHTLVVRKLGFLPVQSRVLVTAGESAELRFRLLSSAQLLADVVVRGDSSRNVFALARAQRHAGGSGTLILRGELDSARGVSVTDLLARRVSGTRLIRYGRTGATLLASSRGPSEMTPPAPSADPADPRSPRACYAQVIVDGVRLWAPGVTRDAVPDLSTYDASRLEAVEFYAGPSSTPVEYGGTGAQCGTILLWLRSSR